MNSPLRNAHVYGTLHYVMHICREPAWVWRLSALTYAFSGAGAMTVVTGKRVYYIQHWNMSAESNATSGRFHVIVHEGKRSSASPISSRTLEITPAGGR